MEGSGAPHQGHDRVSPSPPPPPTTTTTATTAPAPSSSTTEASHSQNMSSLDGDCFNHNPISAKASISSQNTTTIALPKDVATHSGSLPAGLAQTAIHSPNAYAPQTHQFYYGGYGNTPGDWGDYRPFVAAENLEFGSSGIYNDNPSLMFHGGYGYSPQMPYGPYSPVTTPLPAVRGGDGHLYSSPQFPFSGSPYYQQPLPPSVPYITSPSPVSQSELTVPVSIDQQGDNMLFGPRPGYPSQFGSFGRGGSFTGSTDNASFHDSRQGFDGFGSTGPWSDWSRTPDGQRSLTPLSSPAASPQPINMLGSFGRSVGMASQQQRPFYGIGSNTRSVTSGIAQNGSRQNSNFRTIAFPSVVADEGWFALDKARRRGRETAASCGCNGAVDILSEQNRGPRASRSRTQASAEQGLPNDANKTCLSPAEAYGQTFNQPDFVTEYDDAKFFVIKSYSEDNVHKSIRYSVWASTPNGNKKLDCTYREVKEKQGTCPIFLFFSVNASAQFCGVAEMVGPVDFDRNVDYWQQDKWSGQFPVKWHMIKDVPNSQFRHIILENNDNKPVTNSRDTQEVKLEQGIEMLQILKNYEAEASILDDLDYYEERQRLMQERKARQQAVASPVVGVVESNFMLQLPNSFERSVRLDDSNKEDSTTGNVGATTATSVSSAVGSGEGKAEGNSQTVVVSSTIQSS
ncbi:hypothetical protein Sjap_023112 [Stephania japonica]|uniref:YTH domain-containing family protein n=1 Tax=Stephania japonica TaxID=461633 RepID=A0AAP0EQ50_9MAGN